MTVEINFRGIDLVIEGTYDEGEAGQMYFSDMSGIPSSPSGFDINEIRVWDSEEDIYEALVENLTELEGLVLDKIEN